MYLMHTTENKLRLECHCRTMTDSKDKPLSMRAPGVPIRLKCTGGRKMQTVQDADVMKYLCSRSQKQRDLAFTPDKKDSS